MQALLSGRPDLAIFGDAVTRQTPLDYLNAMAGLAEALGATVLVFGSPKNGQAGLLPAAQIEDIPLAFLRRLGRAAAARGVSQGSIDDVLSESLPWLRHSHISEPSLAQIGSAGADDRHFGKTPRRVGYTGWLSIERTAQEPYTPGSVKSGLRAALDAYGSGVA